jgi:hypothetical protein
MASESRFRDNGGKRRRTCCPTLPRQHDLGCRKSLFRLLIRPMAPGVCDDYGDGIACSSCCSSHESTLGEHEGVTWVGHMAWPPTR